MPVTAFYPGFFTAEAQRTPRKGTSKRVKIGKWKNLRIGTGCHLEFDFDLSCGL
jgi:hypothetical protein